MNTVNKQSSKKSRIILGSLNEAVANALEKNVNSGNTPCSGKIIS